jgi:hypothetical protein
MGGIMVPKGQNNSHLRKMSKLYGAVCVATENEKTITAPPSNIYKLRWAEEISIATRLAVNIVVVNEAAAIPHIIPI